MRSARARLVKEAYRTVSTKPFHAPKRRIRRPLVYASPSCGVNRTRADALMLRAVLELTSLALLREEDGCFCSAQPGVPAQAMLLESWAGTQVRSDDRSRVRPTSTLLDGYIARLVQCLASRLVASGRPSKLRGAATADAPAATHHCHRIPEAGINLSLASSCVGPCEAQGRRERAFVEGTKVSDAAR